MRTGSIYDVVDVLKNLTYLSRSKSLSFREKRMLDRAKFLVVSEISEVQRLAAVDVEGRVEKALERCFATKARAIARAKATTTTTKSKVKTVKAVAAAAATKRVAVRSAARAS
jgi:CarD family transcriptional regulator